MVVDCKIFYHPISRPSLHVNFFLRQVAAKKSGEKTAADGMVKRVLKSADYNMDKKMIPVQEGELLVELGPIPRKCEACSVPVPGEDYKFCPGCGSKLIS